MKPSPCYELSSEGGETFIAIGEIETSREWITQLISDYLPPDKKRFKVPGLPPHLAKFVTVTILSRFTLRRIPQAHIPRNSSNPSVIIS